MSYLAFKCSTILGGNALTLRQDLQAGTTDLISTNGLFNTTFTSDDSGPAISDDGRFVACVAAPNNPTNTGVYLWDAQTGTNLLVSVNVDGSGPADGLCSTPVLSADGRRVAFLSDASNLVTNPVDGDFHLYVRDLTTGVTQLVDVDQTGGAVGDMFGNPSFSADGSLVAFESLDDRIATNDLNQAYDVFVFDLTNHATAVVSVRDPMMPVSTANGSSSVAANSLSADGRFAGFVSDASNLAANDTNGLEDVFVCDRLRGTNVLVSVNTNGVSGNGFSSSPIVSADGRFVAFLSTATDLAPNDTDNLPDVYLRDVKSGTTTLISVNLAGTAGGVDALWSSLPLCAVSADGRFVAFASYALGITPDPSGSSDNLFVRDVWNGTTVRVPPGTSPLGLYLSVRPLSPIDPAGSLFFLALPDSTLFYYDQPTRMTRLVGASRAVPVAPAVSANVRFAAYQFLTRATNLVYVYDAVTGSNTLVSVSAGSTLGANSGYKLSVSDDGRFVAFVCDFNHLVANDTNNLSDVFVADAQNPDQLTLVSVNRTGTGPGNAASDSPTMSRDGRFVAFRSAATDLVAGPTDGQPNVYLRDLQTGTTTLLSGNSAGTTSGNGRSSMPILSSDGTVVFFNSQAPDLVAGDLNNLQDVFCYINPVVGRAFPSMVNGRATITWTSVPGHVYRLQYENRLTDTNDWITIPGDVTADQATALKQDPAVPAATQRLYRVLLVR
ncbi:MAG: TolB family protein [Limisphaerales bacterium]